MWSSIRIVDKMLPNNIIFSPAGKSAGHDLEECARFFSAHVSKNIPKEADWVSLLIFKINSLIGRLNAERNQSKVDIDLMLKELNERQMGAERLFSNTEICVFLIGQMVEKNTLLISETANGCSKVSNIISAFNNNLAPLIFAKTQ